MAITTAVCNSWKLEVLDGVHQPGDSYKIALYTADANLGAATTAYTAVGEASGAGYAAGGVELSGRVSAISGGVAYLDFADPSWASATITARGAMIYNATQGNKAVAVFDFGADVSSTAATFGVVLPDPGALATIRIA